MKFIKPSAVNGTVWAPPSKSAMQRCIALALLAKGKSTLLNPSTCADALAAMSVAKNLGAKTTLGHRRVVVHGGLATQRAVLDCRESGLSARMFSPIAALLDTEVTVTGSGTLLHRSMAPVLDSLKHFGVRGTTSNDRLPIKLKGPLQGSNVTMDGSLTSQVVTGLLIALPLCRSDSVFRVDNLASPSYVEMTLSLVHRFGGRIDHDKDNHIFMIPGNQCYQPQTITIEGDWSGAAFLLVAGAVAGRVTVKGLCPGSQQPDRTIVDVLRHAGANVTAGEDWIRVEKASLKGFEFNAKNCPDLFPPLVALATQCMGESRIVGTGRLIQKESNRAHTLVSEFQALGADIHTKNNTMIIKGTELRGGQADSHQDHRIAMAVAVAGLSAQSSVMISNPECVAKSYPNFFEDLENLKERL